MRALIPCVDNVPAFARFFVLLVLLLPPHSWFLSTYCCWLNLERGPFLRTTACHPPVRYTHISFLRLHTRFLLRVPVLCTATTALVGCLLYLLGSYGFALFTTPLPCTLRHIYITYLRKDKNSHHNHCPACRVPAWTP